MRPVLRAYADSEGVDAVMMSGSTARGDADRWSDVEVGVFWSRLPTSAEREAIAVAGGAADLRMVTSDDEKRPWYDHLYLGAPQPDGLMIALDAIKGILDGA